MVSTVALYVGKQWYNQQVVRRSLKVGLTVSNVPQAWATGAKSATRTSTTEVVRNVIRTMVVEDFLSRRFVIKDENNGCYCSPVDAM